MVLILKSYCKKSLSRSTYTSHSYKHDSQTYPVWHKCKNKGRNHWAERFTRVVHIELRVSNTHMFLDFLLQRSWAVSTELISEVKRRAQEHYHEPQFFLFEVKLLLVVVLIFVVFAANTLNYSWFAQIDNVCRHWELKLLLASQKSGFFHFYWILLGGRNVVHYRQVVPLDKYLINLLHFWLGCSVLLHILLGEICLV